MEPIFEADHVSKLLPIQYTNARLEELVSVLSQLTYVNHDTFGNNPFLRAQNLLANFQTVFPVVTFLIDNEYFLNRDTNWREEVSDEVYCILGGYLGSFKPNNEPVIQVADKYSADIALDIVDVYRQAAGDFIRDLQYKVDSDNKRYNREDVSKVIADLMRTSAVLSQYLEEPKKRVFLHGQFLSPFRKARNQDVSGKERVVNTEWNYDNVASFGYSLMGSCLFTRDLAFIDRTIMRLSDYYMLPVLMTLYKDLPAIVDDIDNTMMRLCKGDYSFDIEGNELEESRMFPFTSRISSWFKNFRDNHSEQRETDIGRPSYFKGGFSSYLRPNRPNPFVKEQHLDLSPSSDKYVERDPNIPLSQRAFHPISYLELSALRAFDIDSRGSIN